LKRFTAKFSAWFARLAFWRKPVAPTPKQPDTPAPKTARASRSIEPEASEVAEIPAPPAPKIAWFARLAFWRKPVAPTPPQPDTPAPKTARASRSIEPEPSELAEIPASPAHKLGWFARLKQALRWRRKAAPEPALDPDQTVIVKRPSREQLEASEEIEEEPAPKLSLLTRLRNKLRRQPVLEPLEDTPEEADPGERKRDRARASDDENAEDESAAEDAPKVGFFKRLFAKMCNKWVWIPAVSVMLLSLIGAVLFIVLHTAQEKEKLQAELQETQKQLKKQAALVKKAAAIAVTPKHQADLAAATIGQANPESKPGINPGDCLVTDKESVTKNLKNCIDSFNSTHAANRKP